MKALSPLRRCLPHAALVPALLAAAAGLWPVISCSTPPVQAGTAAAAEKQVTLLYTINNSGYTDVCG